MNGFEQRKKNDQHGLCWINAFGWIRTAELGRLMWRGDRHARTRADRVVRGWIERRLVIVRPLPDGAGRALVLSEVGARLLRDAGKDAISGKDIGETEKGMWIAPANWRHDLLSAGVLISLYELGYTIQPERTIRQCNPTLTKIPDGLAWLAKQPGGAFWLEVENGRKSGKAMQDLVFALSAVSRGEGPMVSGIKPFRVMVAFIPEAKDDREYQLNHQARVTSAIRRIATRDLRMTWVICSMLGHGVAHVSLQEEQITADLSCRILEVLNAGGWTKDEDGVLAARYGDSLLHVWEHAEMGWHYQLDEHSALSADSKTEATRGCARLLSEKTQRKNGCTK